MNAVGPQTFPHQGLLLQKRVFPHTGGADGFGRIQARYIYWALYFYYYYTCSASDHQALDPGGWGPLL